MGTEIPTANNNSIVMNVSMPAKGEVQIQRQQPPAKISKRRKVLRSTFGETKKSPFCWGLAPSTAKKSIQRLVQKIHQEFWTNKTVSDSLIEDLVMSVGNLETNDRLLAAIALCAYCCDTTVIAAEESKSTKPSLHLQLQQVELEIWNVVNSAANIEETNIVDLFEEITDELLDGDGWPEAEVFHEFGLLAASWLRTAVVLKNLGISIDAGAESRLDWMCRQLTRSMRSDGSLLFGEPESGVNSRSFAKSLAKISLDRSIKRLLLQRGSQEKAPKKIRNLPKPSSVSEWAQTSVMRSDWELGSPTLGVLFGQNRIDLELAHKFSVIAGNCTPNIWIDGQLLEPSSEICVTCDLQFDDLDILEVEVEYEDWKLQRQMVMLRDGIVMISDNVLGSERSNIEYRCEFPMADGTQAVEESETTELYVCRGKSYSLVLPLGLPEWKAERTEDRFLAQEGRLVLTQSLDGQCLSAPLLFDLNPKRSVKPRTWRQLTVAENMEIIRKDIAVAFRVQIGKKQWLFYRSLAHKGNRTFLGENVSDEFFVGQIDLHGNVEALAAVE